MTAALPETTLGMPHQDIPQAVWSFYDPNGFLASSEHPEDALMSWLDSKRQQPLDLPHIGAVATRQLVAMEQAHTGAINQENAAEHRDWLGISVGEIEQSVEAAQAYASQTANFCLDALARIRKDHGASKLKDAHDITLAGAILSANTHKGQTRVVGNRPYYSHPRAVALLLRSAHLTHFSDDGSLTLPLHEFKSLLHDGFEDSVPRDGTSFLTATNVLTSPLVLSEMLKRLDAEPATATREAFGMLAMAKTVGIDGKMKYDSYINRFWHHALLIPEKLGDLQHNYRIDSKSPDLADPSKNHKHFLKREEYHQAQQTLLQFFSKSDQITGQDWFEQQLFAAHILTLDHDALETTMRQTSWSQVPATELVEVYEDAVH